MKHLPSLFLAVTGLLLFSTSCVKDNCKRTITHIKYEPVYKTLAEIRVAPTVEGPRDLKDPGKIYLYGTTLLINERSEGVHVVDNSNPSAPIRTAFIKIPGNVDIAMRGNTLYADNYIDLLAIDISDIQNIRVTKRVEDAFPFYGNDPQQGLLVDYDEVEVTETINCNDMNSMSMDPRMTGNGNMQTAGTPTGGGATGAAPGAGRQAVGVGGSMARFAINGQVLYIVDEMNMHVYDIVNPAMPNYVSQINIGRGIETIFPYRDRLFIGSTQGMFIYDNSDPQNPTYISEFQHATACDPVFVEGNFAYVTLRGGTPCGSFNNQLDVIDISNIQSPRLVSTTPTTHPHGLSVDNDHLYLCDGDDGLKVFDISDKQRLSQKFHEPSTPAYDAITLPNSNVVMVVGKDGFYQYNTSNPSSLQLLSHMEVKE
ncbi:MAG: LVIVD repeat-containing protein [Aureispira sp.]